MYLKKLLLFALLSSISGLAIANSRPNVLFIAVDDLRPTIRAYGDPLAKTPNIDQLAAQGTTFTRAYASVPTCGASRASLLTGIRPTSKRFLVARTHIEKDAPGATTIPKHFKDNGYHTVSLGKVTHHKEDIASHWSEEPWSPTKEETGGHLNYHEKSNIKIANERGGKSYPYESSETAEHKYKDALIAAKAVDTLERVATKKTPFFLAVGFSRPHLPFSAPKKYWNLYSENDIRLPDNYFRPKNAPNNAIHQFGELRTYYGVPEEGPVSDDMALKLIHGYYASTSFVDAQIGKVLQKLKDLKLNDNTIVVLWGDHGWNLGEHTLWAKHSNFKTSINAPLIFAVPGKKPGQQARELAEFVDIFPTLCELAGLPVPSHLQGESIVAHIDAPNTNKNTVAFSQWQDGMTMTTDRYSYTEWRDKRDKLYARMLYDHQTDPNENMNIAELKENKALVAELSKRLNEKRDAIQ